MRTGERTFLPTSSYGAVSVFTFDYLLLKSKYLPYLIADIIVIVIVVVVGSSWRWMVDRRTDDVRTRGIFSSRHFRSSSPHNIARYRRSRHFYRHVIVPSSIATDRHHPPHPPSPRGLEIQILHQHQH
jgi:hypothetical protein